MIKKTVSLLFIVASLSLSTNSYAESHSLPQEFTVTERWISLTTTFDIETKTEIIGTVHRKLFSWTPEYLLVDPQENLLAKSKMQFFSFFTVFDVQDYNSHSLGTIKEEFSWFFPTFTIISPDNKKLGEAVLNFWGTEYTISDPIDGHTLVIISRPFLRLKSNWIVKIIDPTTVNEKNIHPHLLMTLAAFQVDREYWEKKRREWEENRGYGALSKLAQTSNSKTALSNDVKNEFRKTLESYRVQLKPVDPTEEDFLFVESFGNFSGSSDSSPEDVEKITAKMTELFDLLSLDQLTEKQKVALFMMLENRLN